MTTKRPDKLNDTEIVTALGGLPGWTLAQGSLHREYIFKDFVAAFSFMSGTALICQRMDHHPDWSNSWNKVRVDLRTHDADGITALDVAVASAMETLAAKLLG